jgi:LuxR family maltose regulon positive regulatory protein
VPPELVDPRLVIPSAPAWQVARPRLLAALDGVADVPLVLLSAGPGAGKTVLLAEWARHRQGRVAWLCPTPDDNEPERFCAMLASAFGVKKGLRWPQARAVDLVHRLRGQLLGRQPDAGPLVLAIDDAHVLVNPQVAGLLDTLVRYGHPQLHVALAARQDPPLPLHRYRLAGQVRELRMPELAMTTGEVRAVLQAHHVTLPPSALNALTARTEGWAAGVRLAAMRMRHAPAPARLVNELSFDYGSVGEYFMAEVLSRLPEPVTRLLIETSFLDEVTAPLAEAITDIDAAGDMLAELARGNLFVIGLDHAGTRFRYHRLFGEVLRHLLRYSKNPMPELASRAAACLESEEDPQGALYWAAKAGDGHRVASVLVRGGLAGAFAHRRAIPAAELAAALPLAATGDVPAGAHPEVPLAALALDAASADSAAAARELAPVLETVAADRQPDAAMRLTRDLVALMIGTRSGDARAVDDAASRLTSRGAPRELAASVLLAQASARFWDGAHDDVQAPLDQALAQARRCELAGVQVDVLAMMACVDSYRSRPRHADDAALQAHFLLRGLPGLRTPPALRLAAAVRSIQKADFPAAARTLRNASPSTAVSADPWLRDALVLWRATVLALSGQARDALVLLGAGTADASPPLLELHRDVLLGEIETLCGRPKEALRHFERHGKGSLAVLVDLPCARAYLALDDLDNARQRIRGVLAGPQLSHYLFVDSLLLDARIAAREGDTGRALDMITNALDVAHADVLLPFVQAREALGDLLTRHPAVALRWPSPPAGARASAGATGPARSVNGLAVRLTPRELAVLAYLTTSLSAADIAAELHLSINTVKTHIAAIYQKLGAGRRREAVKRGRELELL